MNNIFKYIMIAVLLYFGINWVADNPQSVKNIRRMVNTGVASAAKYIREGVATAEKSASQSIDK
jgi:hypothetical protein